MFTSSSSLLFFPADSFRHLIDVLDWGIGVCPFISMLIRDELPISDSFFYPAQFFFSTPPYIIFKNSFSRPFQ
jgi:hypothetical protein